MFTKLWESAELSKSEMLQLQEEEQRNEIYWLMYYEYERDWDNAAKEFRAMQEVMQ